MKKILSINRIITIDNLPRDVRKNYTGKNQDFLTTVYPNGNIWNKKFIKDLNKIDNRFTSTHILYSKMVDFVFRELKRTIIYAVIAIFFLLLIDFRDIKSVLLVLFPLFFAMIMLLGSLSRQKRL